MKGQNYSAIHILDGRYKDVVCKYGLVQFEERTEGEPDTTPLKMKFEYGILENPNEVDRDDQQLINVLGDILVELMEEEKKREDE